MDKNYEALLAIYPSIRMQEPLNLHCTFNIGGLADFFYVCKDIDTLPKLLEGLRNLKIRFFIFGGGSNILFDSRGFRGLVIQIMDNRFEFDNDLLVANSGANMTMLAKLSMQRGLTGLEWANGLPGTIGGAVFGNAGCHGYQIADVFENALIYSIDKGIYEVKKDYMEFAYRHSKIKDTEDIILKVCLKLKKENVNLDQSFDALGFRQAKQPYGYSNGSFFKNPQDYSAGYLIESVGLKGFEIGGAKISDKHANFFMNINNALSSDVLALRDLAKKKVHEKYRIMLEEEVVVVDE